MAAEVIHGTPCRFTDPARFSLAHGGKDGHPYPVPLRVYDETIRVLRRAVDRARLGEEDRAAAVRKLDAEARRLEADAAGPAFDAFVDEERGASATYAGRSVLGEARAPKASARPRAATEARAAPSTPTPTPNLSSKPARSSAPAPAQLSLFRRR
jgi:hypothetical protein